MAALAKKEAKGADWSGNYGTLTPAEQSLIIVKRAQEAKVATRRSSAETQATL
jgi:hypothetical protein